MLAHGLRRWHNIKPTQVLRRGIAPVTVRLAYIIRNNVDFRVLPLNDAAMMCE